MSAGVITAVGIDVSKYKSTVAARRPGGEVALLPFDVGHDVTGIKNLLEKLQGLDDEGSEIRIVMEHTGMYWRPVALALQQAGFFVSVVNAILIHNFSDNSLRKVKTDKADALKIANYQSGTFDAKNRHVSKRGSPHLRKVLFEIASMILVHGNPDNSVFCFMDKKRAEGKHFYVYTVAGAAKFLRIWSCQEFFAL